MQRTKVVKRIIAGETGMDIYNDLYDICSSVHAQCNDDCPIHFFDLTGSPKGISDCDCFKKGQNMHNAIHDFLFNTSKGKRILEQQEFVEWLKTKDLYHHLEKGGCNC